MKADTYFNICLEQAALSPLRYRHGSIIVKGGKVIGKGFNDFRPGYDGGHLHINPCKNPASASLLESSRLNQVLPGANAALSMHAEMAAIRAIVFKRGSVPISSTSKPHFKLPGKHLKRAEDVDRAMAEAGERMRRAQLKQQRTAAVRAAEWRFEACKCEAGSVVSVYECVSTTRAAAKAGPASAAGSDVQPPQQQVAAKQF
ncbi:hypothetical protein PspLS_02940 [Pyricularia sp. CBS 133598]|nr:hypothetical protein PspLS_02940 [Pyricularia sp. CBS 133598]